MYVNVELNPKHTEILQIQKMKSEEYMSHTLLLDLDPVTIFQKLEKSNWSKD